MSLKIAIMGIRGIPANYGGFETFTENLSTRLVKHGHDVTVYGRSNCIDYQDKYYKGVHLVILPTISHKYLDTIAHTCISAWHAYFTGNYDVILICNSANSSFAFIPRLAGIPVALNVDGLEWKRQKWNILGKGFYLFSEWLATFLPTEIVTDAKIIENYYRNKFGKSSTCIPYGTPVDRVQTTKALEQFNLKPREYILYVSRLEPENNAQLVVSAYEKVKSNMKLVIVGDAPYNNDYIKKLKSTQDPRIIFTGYVFGTGYRELQSNAYVYIQATEVGGTHPALLEAMGHGNCILANDVPEHHEVIKNTGHYFNGRGIDDLCQKIQYLNDHPSVVEQSRQDALERVKKHYTWDKITEAYERLFYRIADREYSKQHIETHRQDNEKQKELISV